MRDTAYVHGYSQAESDRLYDQAETLSLLLHHDSLFTPGSRVLEPGCGTGAQTLILADLNPDVTFFSMDISSSSVEEAKRRLGNAGIKNARVEMGDLMDLAGTDGLYDHAIVCFLLEHLKDPVSALVHLKRLVKPGGTIMVIEGDHGLVAFHPESEAAMKAISCQIELQKRHGGDACIGRRLYPYLSQAGIRDIHVSPRMVYVDGSRPDLAEGFIRKTFTSMIEGVKDDALLNNLISLNEWEEGINGLKRTAYSDGTFCYTFFKAFGVV